MEEELDIEHLVLNTILTSYKTPEVEQNLSTFAILRDELGLSEGDIHYLGLKLEHELHMLGYRNLKDEEIISWLTVEDIIQTILKVAF